MDRLGIILGLVAVYCTAVLGQNPEITEAIIPEIRRMGVTGKLHCSVINQLNNPVYWIHKNTQTVLSSDDRIIIDQAHNTIVNGWPKFQVEKSSVGERVTYTIIVNRLEPRDAGVYTCQILVRGSTEHPFQDGQMIVLIPPAIIQSSTTHTVTVRENQGINLTCDASGYPPPNITWVRVNGNVLPNGHLRYQNTLLNINTTLAADRGVYRCLADNSVRPPASHDATMLVLFRPISNAIQDSYGQAENRMFDVTVECRIAGWPEPDLQWFKVLSGGNWDPITTSDRYTINILLNHANILSPNERWFQLVIRAVVANDFGDYVCEGRNDHGTGHDTLRLFATSECQGPNCPPEQSPPGAAATHHASLTTLITLAASLLVLR